MFFDVCWMLVFVGLYVVVECCLLLFVWHVVFAICLLIVVRCWLFVVRCSLFDVRCLFVVVCIGCWLNCC